jgi:phage-related protein
MGKVITWVMLNGATLLGCLQAVVKAVKELLTGVVNLVSIFLPDAGSKKLVEVVREALNKIDDVIESIKDFLIK